MHETTMIKGLYRDHKDTEAMSYLARLIGLTKVNDPDECESFDRFVLFVHEGLDFERWFNVADQSKIVVFVSIEDHKIATSRANSDNIREGNRGYVRSVSKSFSSLMDTLKANENEIAKKIKSNLERGAFPDWSFLDGPKWPEKVLARYLIEIAQLKLNAVQEDELGLTNAEVMFEFKGFRELEASRCKNSEVKKLLTDYEYLVSYDDVAFKTLIDAIAARG